MINKKRRYIILALMLLTQLSPLIGFADDSFQTFKEKSGVRSISFNSEGTMLATGNVERGVKLWDIQNREFISYLKGSSASSVVFRPDGMLVSGVKGDSIKLWDVKSRKLEATIKRNSEIIETITLSPDGKTLAFSGLEFVSGSIRSILKLWDIKRNKLTATIKDNSLIIETLAFSPDGKTLASGGKGNAIELWDIKKSKLVKILKGHSAFVTSVAFSPDGKTLASGSKDRTIKLWDVKKRNHVITLKGHSRFITSVAFSPDGKTLASGSKDKTIKLWDVNKRKLVTTLKGHSGLVTSVEFSPDGKTLASGSLDKTTKLWDTEVSNEEVATTIYNGIDKQDLMVIDKFYKENKNKNFDIISQLMNDIVILVKEKNTIKDYLWFIDNYPQEVYSEEAINSIFTIIAKKNTIKDYQWFLNSYSNHEKLGEAINGIFTIIAKKNTIKDYQWFSNMYPEHEKVDDAINGIFAIVVKKNTIKHYQWFINTYPNHEKSGEALEGIFILVAKKNTIKDYQWFLDQYPQVLADMIIRGVMYAIIDKKDTIKDYKWHVDTYPHSPFSLYAIKKIYIKLKNENNIFGYAWFINNYSGYVFSKLALFEMQKIAYEISVEENTLESYNDFIIAYPFSKQAKEALNISYSIEDKMYSGWWFNSSEKKSRALRVKMKQLEIKMNEIENLVLKKGYLLILNRMSQLLQNKFPEEEVTIRFLESNIFNQLHENYKLLTILISTIEGEDNATDYIALNAQLFSPDADVSNSSLYINNPEHIAIFVELYNTNKVLELAIALSDLTPALDVLINEIDSVQTQSRARASAIFNYFPTNAQSSTVAEQYTEQLKKWEQYLERNGIVSQPLK